MASILAPTYFRLVYLLQFPLLCALALSAIIVTFSYSYRGLLITSRDAKLGIGLKLPRKYQLLPANIKFAKAAGSYIAHAKLLIQTRTAGCELPLLFLEMKVVAPRLVVHYFANAGNAEEGILRQEAQVFIQENPPENVTRLQVLEPRFREVIKTGRPNAVALAKSQSDRVLATLQSIDAGWYHVLEAGGLVLMVPGDSGPNSRN